MDSIHITVIVTCALVAIILLILAAACAVIGVRLSSALYRHAVGMYFRNLVAVYCEREYVSSHSAREYTTGILRDFGEWSSTADYSHYRRRHQWTRQQHGSMSLSTHTIMHLITTP